MPRTRSNAPGGCRLGLGCILLFSLSTNAYLIFLFHRTAGKGGGAPTGQGAWYGMGGPPVPERWQQDNVGSGTSEEPDGEPALEAGRRGLRGGATEDEMEITAAEENPSLRGSNLSREEGTDESEREVMAEAKQEEEGTDAAEKESPSGEDASDGNDANVVAGEEQNPPADGQGQSPEEKPWPKPDGWDEMGFYDIRKHFDCSTYAHDQTKPLPTLEDWQFFRDRYREIVDDSIELDDPVPPTDGYTFGDGGPPPYYAAHSKDGRGRGLFASRDIKKGELVHNGEQSDIVVPSGMAWRRFIFSLPRKKACDVIDWSWTAKTERKGPWKIFTAMNISILMNGGSKDTWNVNPKSSTSSKFYATKDIKKDEELLMDYEMYDTVWGKVGLGSESYVDDDDDEPSTDEDNDNVDENNAYENNASAAEQVEQQSNDDRKEAGMELVTAEESPSPTGQRNKLSEDSKESEWEEPPVDKQNPAEMPWPKPDGWDEMGFYEIRKHFDCSTYAHDPTKPLPTLEDWQFFRKKYIEIVDNGKKFDDPVPPADGYTFGDGGPPPYYAAHSKDGRGRGLFASRDIKKGELVDDGDIGDVVFPSAMAWRRYIFALPRNKACDMIDWSWTQQKEENGPWRIVAGMNISVLSNTEWEEDSLNVNPKSSTSSKFYATRDIKKGEEILTDYEVYDTVWDKVGLGSENYADDDDEPSTDEDEQHPSDKAKIVEKKNAVPTDEKEQTADDNVEPQAEKESQSTEKKRSPQEAPLPLDGWERMGFYEIRKHFDCSTHAHDQTKPLPTLEDWRFLREMYRETVDDTQEFDDPVSPTDGYTFLDRGPPPYYAAHSKDGRGRGLFASRDIKKGELVHNGEQSDILVPSGMKWRRFVLALPRKKACDVIDWTWTQKTERKGPWKIFTAMNISILLNGGSKDTWNVNPKSSTSSKFYATRDIKKDEELLTDYEIYDTVWHKVGLGSED